MKDYEKYILDSKNIRRIKYYAVGHLLEIQFVGGKLYHYHEVPESLFDSFMAAESAGKFFNEHVRNHYSYEIITE